MTAYHILVATDLTDESLNLLATAADVTTSVVTPRPEAVRAAIGGAHALIARDDVLVDADLLRHADNLRVIARVGTSLSGIDIEAATGRGKIGRASCRERVS